MIKGREINYKKIISYIIGLMFVLYESIFSLMLFVMLFIVVATYDPTVKIFTAYNIVNSLYCAGLVQMIPAAFAIVAVILNRKFLMVFGVVIGVIFLLSFLCFYLSYACF